MEGIEEEVKDMKKNLGFKLASVGGYPIVVMSNIVGHILNKFNKINITILICYDENSPVRHYRFIYLKLPLDNPSPLPMNLISINHNHLTILYF